MRYRFICDQCKNEFLLTKKISEPFPKHVFCEKCGGEMHQQWRTDGLAVPEEMKAENIQRESYIHNMMAHSNGPSGERTIY